jgi:hypothetical protein
MPNYPSSLDSLANPTATTLRNDPGFEHHLQHGTANDICEALELKLGIGSSVPTTAGHVLTVTGAGATAYQASAAVRLGQTVLVGTQATITLASIPTTFECLLATVYARSSQASTNVELWVRFNGDAGGNYLWQDISAQGTASAVTQGAAANQVRAGFMPGASATANLFGAASLMIPGYARTVGYKAMTSLSAEAHAFTAGSFIHSSVGAHWLNTAAINSMTISPSAGSLVAGTVFTLYGLPA